MINKEYHRYKTASTDRYDILKEKAQKLRQFLTPQEEKLWNYLKDRTNGFNFRCQHIIGDYIVDFVCLKAKLIIEIDGGYHFEGDQPQEDLIREHHLQELGYKIIRFSNEEVDSDIKSILDKIYTTASQLLPPSSLSQPLSPSTLSQPLPSPLGEGTGRAFYGLIGFPLGHSFSRKFFNEEFFPENGIDAEYRNFEIPDAKMLLDIVRENPNLRGLNCTIPHKQAIMPLLDEIDPLAQKIGAVNVVKIKDGRLKGYNSDIIGFIESIKPLLKPHHNKALILGTGGASKAIYVGLVQLGIKSMFVSRTAKQGLLTYSDIDKNILQEYTVIVNCSPVGMFPKVDECPDIPYDALTPQHLLYDLVYNPDETLFMARGRSHGATVKNGLEMLRLQALASWEIWNKPL